MSAVDDEEIYMLKSFALLKQWLTEHSGKVSWTAAEYRQEMKRNPIFCMPTFILGWGDSFLLDQMFFRAGGNHKFSDFPTVPASAQVGDTVSVDGIERVISSAGLLTFQTV